MGHAEATVDVVQGLEEATAKSTLEYVEVWLLGGAALDSAPCLVDEEELRGKGSLDVGAELVDGEATNGVKVHDLVEASAAILLVEGDEVGDREATNHGE